VRKFVVVAAGLAISIFPLWMRSAAAQVAPVTVALCDATTITWSPYVYTTVVIDSLEAAQNVGGYGDKVGPIFNPHAPQTTWGDIIPPFNYGEFSYPGLNWTTTGQLIFKGHNKGHPNGCVDDLEYPPTPTPSPSPTHTHTKTPTPSSVEPSSGGDSGGTAFTGGNFTGTFAAIAAFVLIGLSVLLVARKRVGVREDTFGSPRDLF
jgi:hypothetical protein